ncbi:hypothetical protein EW093_10985 [Thiospirochaeta perfilievii]|uniref:Uncharacterized protein n=1 Tax=Thiospirochaeta perfilievii TaxID=252967 RepID=A0A5C1QAR6_9SPIO|nr:hypothetical protein [Thiospirochaeta perfilievii]QEN05213.1 hypothetical protein EW093_10985 [Thiospirochaeta perfilievii]
MYIETFPNTKYPPLPESIFNNKIGSKEHTLGRHKLPYKMKKPNKHHRYWRYVLSTGPRTEISTKTRVKYEAERIAKEAYQKSLIERESVMKVP